MTETAMMIEKELIPSLTFETKDVLQTSIEQNLRNRMLYRAMLLGNNYKSKVKLTFVSKEGIRIVETTIWATTETNVILKGGIFIPICTITDVSII